MVARYGQDTVLAQRGVDRRGQRVDGRLYGIIGVLAFFFFNRVLNRAFAMYVFPPPGTSVER